MVIKILMSMEQEIWRDVPGYEGKFRVSNQERFINLNYKAANEPRIYGMDNMIKPQKSNPYYKVSVGRRHIAFHQLVAMAFPDICGEYFEGCEVHHINGDKHDNRPENLKVVSVQEHRSLHPKSDEEKDLMKKRNAGSNNPFYGKHHTMEQREKWRISRKGRDSWNKGKKMSEEYRKKNSEAHKGLQAGEKNGMYGRHRTEREKDAVRQASSKPVLQYTISGDLIKRWPSAQDAINATGIQHLRRCAQGVSKSAGGFIWVYEERINHSSLQSQEPSDTLPVHQSTDTF